MLLHPVQGHPVTSKFAEWPQWRKDMNLLPHSGMDFAAPEGTIAKATFSAQVIESAFSNSIGNYVTLHATFENQNKWIIDRTLQLVAVYMHLRDRSVQVGEAVKIGHQVGLTGNTGSATTGPHLHFTLRWFLGDEWMYVDPAMFLSLEDDHGENFLLGADRRVIY